MEFVNKLMPVLWRIIEKKKRCSINVSTVDEKLTVCILTGRRKQIFSNNDVDFVLFQLERYLAA